MSVKRYSLAGTNATPCGWHEYVMASDYDALMAENLRLRDRVLAAAAACESCSGTGLVSIFEQIDPDDITKGCREAVQECGDCADWREALGQ